MSFEDRFRDQVAIVTGGASGIGLAIGNRIASEGGIVILADINSVGLARAALAADSSQSKILTEQVDVTSESEVSTLIDKVLVDHDRLDIMVNSAGIVGPTSTDIIDYDLRSFREVLDVNLVGSFILIKHAVRAMLPRDYGRILLLASIAGKEGNPGMAGYSTSKAGVIGLVKGIAKEYAHTGITINALAPALLDTPLTDRISEEQLEYMTRRIPMGRLGTTAEAAALACWLVSDEASFNTGAVFDLSGGRATY